MKISYKFFLRGGDKLEENYPLKGSKCSGAGRNQRALCIAAFAKWRDEATNRRTAKVRTRSTGLRATPRCRLA